MKIHWRERWRDVFAIDLRALALFRFMLGSVLAVDMVNRCADLTTFYTDWGVMPRSYVVDTNGPLRLSLHLANGDAWFAGLLLAIEGLAAVALALGYRTRLACVAAFILENSLLNRNPMVLLGADSLLVCLLFWSLFLPLHARWSVDAALSERAPPQESRHVSFASAGLILQVLCVYFFSALLKSDPQWWPDGTAVYYTMMLDRYTTPLGRHLLQYPKLMQALTYYVWFLELLGPIVALSPLFQRPLRFLTMAGLMAMHTGFILCMEIGLFPFVSLSSLCVLLGGWWWDWADRRVDHGRYLRIYYDGECAFCLKSCLIFRTMLALPRTEITPAQSSQRAYALMQAHYSWVVIDGDDVAHTKWNAFVALLRHSLLFGWVAPIFSLKLWERPGVAIYDWVGRHRGIFGNITGFLLRRRSESFEVSLPANALAALSIVAVLAWNMVTIDRLPMSVAAFLEPVMRPLHIDQGWPMFAPHPWEDDGWYVIPGLLEDGSELDLITRRPVDWDKPDNVAAVEPNIRWRTYHSLIWNHQLAGNRDYYARWLCRDWNASAQPGHRLLKLQIIYLLEHTPPPGQSPSLEQRVLWRHDCTAKGSSEPPPTEHKKAPGEEEKRRPV